MYNQPSLSPFTNAILPPALDIEINGQSAMVVGQLVDRVYKRARSKPRIGDTASGYGVGSTVASIPGSQPLAEDGIWRVTLKGEAFGRLARSKFRPDNGVEWQLLQMDDITDSQLEKYEAVMLEQAARRE